MTPRQGTAGRRHDEKGPRAEGDDVACSEASRTVGEQLAGSAPLAVAWVALEQNGPWGAKALRDSHLAPSVGRELEESAGEHGIRPALIREPGRHADVAADASAQARRLLVAFTDPHHTWLLDGLLAEPGEVLKLDWAALAVGDVAAVQASLPVLQPSGLSHLLVCTNGTRDVCCAKEGRPLAREAATRFPGQVWEVTHTSGHRFAPTAVLLPAGTLHGRLSGAGAAELLTAAGRGETVLAGSRGRSTWPAPAQVAELAVREETGELSLSALRVTVHESRDEHVWSTVVEHRDGRAWSVLTRSVDAGTARAESCRKAPTGLRRYVTEVGIR